MTEGGFLATRTTNKTGLALVVAGHAAVLTALALAPPEAVQRIVYTRLIAENYKEAPPPPPEKAPPPARREQAEARPTATNAIVRTDATGPIMVTQPDPRPLPQIEPVQTIKATPTLLPATMEPGAMARFQPDYPPALLRADIEGLATVRVLIGSDGRVKAVEMVNATDPAFFEATRRQALRFWKFRPATSDGVATESWRTMTVRFTIQS